MPIPRQTWKGRRLLAIDGRGPCGMSTIVLMDELMRRVQRELGLSEPPRPGEVFDLMAGSGMGGLLVIMWGRLRMSVDESKKYFKAIGDEAFSEKKRTLNSSTTYKTSKLEHAIKNMLVEYLGSTDARMNDPQSSEEACKTFVCVTLKDTMRAGMSALLRSYPTAIPHYGSHCSVFETIQATCTSVGLFKPTEIMEPSGVVITYVDGTIGNSNPTPHLLREAGLVFPGEEVACVISLGAGQGSTISVPDSGPLQSAWASELNTMLMAVATDCERTAERMEELFEHLPGVYYRFSVDQGLQNVGLADWEKSIVSHTWVYLQLSDNEAKMRCAAYALGKNEGKVLAEQMTGSIPAPVASVYKLPHCPSPSRTFVGREGPLALMREYFFDSHSLDQSIFVLYGLGGSGKSQLAYKFADLHKNRYDEVFYIDATSEETIDAHFKAIAVVKKAGHTLDDALSWLAGQSQNWLLIFDNADCATRNIKRFFQSCSRGNILVTTRNHGMVILAHCKDYQVSGLSPDDALKLLLEASQAKGEFELAGPALVKELGYFALAIAHAAAFIRARQCTIQDFRDMYKKSRGYLLEENLTHIPEAGDYEQTAHAIWRMCYEKLSPTASRLFNVFASMHHGNISEEIFQRASKSLPLWLLLKYGQQSQKMTLDILRDFMKGGSWDKCLFLECIKELRSYSLIDFDPYSQHYSIHPLVQHWVRGATQNAELAYSRCVASLLLLSWDPLAHSTHSYSTYCRTIAPHIDALPEAIKYHDDFCSIFAHIYFRGNCFKEAEILQQIDLRRSKDLFGDRSIAAFESEQQLIAIQSAQGRWSDVAQAQSRLAELTCEIFGDNNLGTIQAREHLAITYSEQARWPEAETIEKEVLSHYENRLGRSHPQTCTARAFLIFIYHQLGKAKEAEILSNVVSKVEILGNDELEKLRLYNFPKIQVLFENGQLKEAAVLQREIVSASSQLHGDDDERTLSAKGRLAATLAHIPEQAAKSESEDLAKEIVTSFSRDLGPDHPCTLAAKHDLAQILSSHRDPVNTEAMLREVLEKRQKMLGPTDRASLSARLSLGINLLQQKRWPDAEALLDCADPELRQALKEQPMLNIQFLAALSSAQIFGKSWPAIHLALSVSFGSTAFAVLWDSKAISPTIHSILFCLFLCLIGFRKLMARRISDSN